MILKQPGILVQETNVYVIIAPLVQKEDDNSTWGHFNQTATGFIENPVFRSENILLLPEKDNLVIETLRLLWQTLHVGRHPTLSKDI